MADRLTKRQFLRQSGAALAAGGTVGLAGCSSGSGGDGDSTQTTSTATDTPQNTSTETDEPLGSSYDQEHSVLIADGNIHVPFYLSPDFQEYFTQRGVDIAPEVVAFERSTRALSTGPAMLNPTAPAGWINVVNQDNEIALIGSELKQINGIFTLPDSSIEEPQDLEGARVGLPFLSSGTTKMMGAMLQESYDIDVREDVESQEAPPAVIYRQMVEEDALDAVMLWTGTTVEALASDDLQQVMSATDHWEEQTGQPPTILNYGVRRDWLEEYPGEALGYVRAWEDGVNWAFEEEQVESLYQQFGRLAGITSDAEFDKILELFDEERVLMRDQSTWNEDFIDAQWELYEIMEETGFVENAPSRDLGISHSELADMA